MMFGGCRELGSYSPYWYLTAFWGVQRNSVAIGKEEYDLHKKVQNTKKFRSAIYLTLSACLYVDEPAP